MTQRRSRSVASQVIARSTWPLGWEVMKLISAQMVLLVSLVNSAVVGPALAQSASDLAQRPIQIVALGDSLTSGYGIDTGSAFPEKLQRALRAGGHKVEIQNAGVAGDTTAGGLARLDWAVPDGTELVILELGANDMLSGLPPDRARANLDAIVTRLKGRGVEILLAGMRATRNLGAAYVESFDSIYPDLAARYDLVIYPFFLDGVALDPKLNQPDGIHPTATGVDEIVRRITPTAERALDRVLAKRRKAVAQ